MVWALNVPASGDHLSATTLGYLLDKKLQVVSENVTWDGSTGYLWSQANSNSAAREFGLFANGTHFRLMAGGSNNQLSSVQNIVNETVDLTVDYSASTATLIIGGITVYSGSISIGTGRVEGEALRFFSRGGGFYLPAGSVCGNTLFYIDDVLDRNYSADDSDHTNGGGAAPYPQPILIDTVGSNDATGINFPTDNLDYWINLGGGSLTISPVGIGSTISFGNPTLLTSKLINPTSIDNLNTFGSHTILVSPLILPTGISSTEALGNPTVLTSQFIEPSSITSTIVFGLAELKAGNQYLVPISIDPTTEFGLASIYSAVQYINVNGIPSGVKYGRPIITGGEVVIVKSYTTPITTVIFKKITRDIVGN